MPARLVTPASDEPVDVDEAKAQLRLEVDTDNAFLARLIVAARLSAEEYLWRGLLAQTWELVLPCFPDDGCLSVDRQGVMLPMGQTSSVTEVKYIDPNGVEQTWSTSEYVLDDVNVPGRLRRAYGKSWPATRAQWDAVRIKYVVGWADVDELPENIKQALLLHVSEMYEKRLPEVDSSDTVKNLLRPYRLARF